MYAERDGSFLRLNLKLMFLEEFQCSKQLNFTKRNKWGMLVVELNANWPSGTKICFDKIMWKFVERRCAHDFLEASNFKRSLCDDFDRKKLSKWRPEEMWDLSCNRGEQKTLNEAKVLFCYNEKVGKKINLIAFPLGFSRLANVFMKICVAVQWDNVNLIFF